MLLSLSKPGSQHPLRQKSLFWHNLWCDNGAPQQGLLADLKRKAKADYHKAVKYVKRNRQKLASEKMANALLENRDRDFWSEVKKVRGHSTSFASQIDDLNGAINISNHFSSKFEDVYNSVAFDNHDMQVLMLDLNNDISDTLWS